MFRLRPLGDTRSRKRQLRLGAVASAPKKPRPVDYAPDGSWPDGPLAPDAPPEAHLAAALARRLKKEIGCRPLRRIAARAGVSAPTISHIVNGKTWPDLRTLARLEVALGKRLWGKEHRDAAGGG